MKQFFKKRIQIGENDLGAALAMVLIFIVLFSLLMGSVAVLVRSSSAVIESTKSKNLLRASIVQTVIPLAVSKLTQNGVRFGMANNFYPCQPVFNGNNFPIDLAATQSTPAYSDVVSVECIQSSKSGESQPIASFALTGSDCYIPSATSNCVPLAGTGNETTAGIVGQDGGLQVDPGMTNPPLLVTGGLINVSGAWNAPTGTIRLKKSCQSVNNATVTLTSANSDGTKVTYTTSAPISGWAVGNLVSISSSSNSNYNFSNQEIISIPSTNQFVIQPATAPNSSSTSSQGSATAQICPNEPISQIIQPTNTEILNCPSNGKYKNSLLTTSPCTCPWGAIGTNASCPTGNTGIKFSTINPEDTASDLGSYIESISSALEDVRSDTPATILNTCEVPYSTSIAGKIFQAARVAPGFIDSAKLIEINTLLKNTNCGDGTSKPAIQFMPGIYRLSLSAVGTARSNFDANVLNISGGSAGFGLTVIGGEASTSSFWDATNLTPKWECDLTQKGVQFQFQGASYMKLSKGYFTLCPLTSTKPIFAAPSRTRDVSNAGNSAPFFWLGARTDPIFENSAGNASSCAVCMDLKGQVFAPAGFLRLNFNGQSSVIFRKGVIARALTIVGTGSASSAGEVTPPSPFNGDRIVQLRIKSQKLGDLGIVQLVIRDYFGRRLGSGYKIISWRTAW